MLKGHRKLKTQLGKISENPSYGELTSHKRIDAFTRVSFHADRHLTNAYDFSNASIEERISLGRATALKQGIGSPQFLGP